MSTLATEHTGRKGTPWGGCRPHLLDSPRVEKRLSQGCPSCLEEVALEVRKGRAAADV